MGETSPAKSPAPSAQHESRAEGKGCFYTINTLMILFALIPALVLLILAILWLIPD